MKEKITGGLIGRHTYFAWYAEHDVGDQSHPAVAQYRDLASYPYRNPVADEMMHLMLSTVGDMQTTAEQS